MDQLGAVRRLFDEHNALRQTVYGEPAALPHKNPAAMLHVGFGNRFFSHEPYKGIESIRDPRPHREAEKEMSRKTEKLAKYLFADRL